MQKEYVSATGKARYAANKEKRKAYREANKERRATTGKAWYKANKERKNKANKDRELRRKYGLTLKQRDAMITAQDNRCLCCKTLFGLLRAHRPHVDHCHATGRVRGILCSTCNRLLGAASDSPKVLRNGALYLEKYA